MKNVLVVDDLASVRFYHRFLLEQNGYRALVAADGEEALGMLEHEAVDLVMLDLMMPKLSGADFLQRARALPQFAQVPVLVITSEAQRESTQQLNAGRCVILQKPLLPDALLAAVRQLAG